MATKGTEVKSTSPTAADAPVIPANPEALTTRSHGFIRILNRPVQWLIIISLLISWSVAGVVMFDFVSDDQITSIQEFGSDPISAMDKAFESIENGIHNISDMFSNGYDYITEMSFNPMDAVSLAADLSANYLSGIFSGGGDFGVIETVAVGGTVLDEATEWVRFPVCYLFHMFEDVVDMTIIYPADMASVAVVKILSEVKTAYQYLSSMLGGIEVPKIPKMSTDPMKLAGNVAEEANKLKNSISSYLSNLFVGDEGGIPDISFDPMKVVTDTVEEFADRRDMFLAYLSNMIMEDKDDTPQVIRRKGEFLPPMEKGMKACDVKAYNARSFID